MMNNQEHDRLALDFIKLEEFYRDLPRAKTVFDMAQDVIRAAPHTKTPSGDMVFTTPVGSNATLHATALDRALQAVGITTHTSRLANSDILKDISNRAARQKGSIDELFHQPEYDHVETTVPGPSILQGIVPK